MQGICNVFDRALFSLPLESDIHPDDDRSPHPTVRGAGTLLAAVGGGISSFLISRLPSTLSRTWGSTVTVWIVAGGMIATYKCGWEGGDHSGGALWRALALPEDRKKLLIRRDYPNTHKFWEMGREEAIQLAARAFFGGVGIVALGRNCLELKSALSLRRNLEASVGGIGIVGGVFHLILWQVTDGGIPIWTTAEEVP